MTTHAKTELDTLVQLVQVLVERVTTLEDQVEELGGAQTKLTAELFRHLGHGFMLLADQTIAETRQLVGLEVKLCNTDEPVNENSMVIAKAPDGTGLLYPLERFETLESQAKARGTDVLDDDNLEELLTERVWVAGLTETQILETLEQHSLDRAIVNLYNLYD